MRIAESAALIAALGCAAIAMRSGETVELSIAAPVTPESNIRAADYVGPEVCGECHGRRFAQWSTNLHRSMNRMAGDPGAIAGDFSGVELQIAGSPSASGARFDRDSDGAPIMILEGRRYRVTRTIGSRYIQEYVGRDDSGVEVRLPFGYWISRGRWYHNQYYDSWYGPEHTDAGEVAVDVFAPDPFDSRCAWCHNTYPFELRIARADAGRITAFGPEAHVTAPVAPRPGVVEENRLPLDELVTVGISCESCHLGGRDHAIEGRPIRFFPTAPDLRKRAGGADLGGGRASAVAINTICAQCHSAPSPRWPSGAARRNSREALDLAASSCEPRCTDCHDPHQSPDRSRSRRSEVATAEPDLAARSEERRRRVDTLRGVMSEYGQRWPADAAAAGVSRDLSGHGPGGGAPTEPHHLEACARCHADKARGHAGHAQSDASCLDCHMPRIVQGFSHVVRSHRIGSPSPAQVIAGREPDACGLCHLDRSPRWILEALARGWVLRLERGAAPPSIDVDRPIGDLWLESTRSIVRITAADAIARRGKLEDAPRIIEQLDDPVAYVRMRLLIALEDLTGERWEPGRFDPRAPPGKRWTRRP